MDETEPGEAALGSSSPPPKLPPGMSLDKAIEMGEYDPDFLSQFPEWHSYTRHIQFELIKKALVNRRKQLLLQWMEINRANDYRLKPHLQQASDSIDKQLEKLTHDKEILYAKYTIDNS